MDYTNLSQMQLDALREVCNIGAGNAATAMSQMLNVMVDMSVPSVNVIPFEKIIDHYDSEEAAVAVVVRVLGETPGNILIVFDEETTLNIIELLTGSRETGINEFGSSVICEIGNILSGAFMNSISQFTNLTNVASVPAMAYDMLGAILSTIFIEAGQHDEYVLDLETVFLQGGEKKIDGRFFYVPVPGSLEKILTTLGVN